MLTQKLLKEELSYDEHTGQFKSLKHHKFSKRYIGDIVGSTKTNGYIEVYLLKKYYQAHRLAWFYIYGKWPSNQIDHINGIKSDNRLCNLREANYSENAQNLIKSKITNTTKLLGVRKKKNRNGYEASIKLNGKSYYLGYFKNAIDAHTAYIDAKRKYHIYGRL